MDAETLKILGQAGGLGGIAVGVLLLVFREIVRKSIFPMLKKEDAFRIMRLIIVLTWSVALAGIAAWVVGARSGATMIETHGDQSPVVSGSGGPVNINIRGGKGRPTESP